jgi:LysM repeat protein
MKILTTAALFFFAVLTQTLAQAPVYLMFDWTCTDQLEYRTNAGGKLLVFNYHPIATEQYLLTAGEGVITSATEPSGTINCRDFRLDEMLVDVVNRHTRLVYVVQQTQTGYMLTPIVSAMQVSRSGSIYKIYTTDCSFAADTNNLNYNQNLVLSGDANIYFTGYKICDCRLQYSFEREPGRANKRRSDIELIPGIGIITDRSGNTNAEKDNNQISLVKVNNQLLDDYLATRCQRRPPLRTTMSRWAGNPLPEPTRETYPAASPTIPADLTPVGVGGPAPAPVEHSTGNRNPTPTYVTVPTNCTEPFTYGYHVVQRGETAGAIARAYNLDVKTLCVANQVTNPNKISVCQKLRIPETKGGTVTAGPTAQRQFNWGDVNTPNQYFYTNNPPPSAVTYSTTPQSNPYNNIPPGQTIGYSGTGYYHIVQPGEYLYGIARSHGLNEAQIRKYNGFAPLGTITLFPGDQLWLVDPNEAYRNGQTLPPSGGTERPQQYNNTTPRPTNSFIEEPTDGVYYREPNGGGGDQQFTPRNVNGEAPYIEPLQPQQYGYNNVNRGGTNNATPSHFNEHIVKYGETIGSIAQTYGLSVNQLTSFNEKTEKEALIPGQKVLIPRY